jgi:hypothetical protein
VRRLLAQHPEVVHATIEIAAGEGANLG